MTFFRKLISLIGILPVLAQQPQAFVPNKGLIPPIPYHEPKIAVRYVEPVKLLILIDPKGTVVRAEVLSGNPQFHTQALEDAKKLRYRAVIRDGQPVFAYTTIVEEFFGEREPTPVQQDAAVIERLSNLARQFPRTPQQELADFELDLELRSEEINSRTKTTPMTTLWLGTSEPRPSLMKLAARAEAWEKAASYANDALKFDTALPSMDARGSMARNPQLQNDGHTILGLAALQKDDVAEAKGELLASGQLLPKAYPANPNMTLARELLKRGERDVVLQYFTLCKIFWNEGIARLDEWSAQVRAGATPDFPASLLL